MAQKAKEAKALQREMERKAAGELKAVRSTSSPTGNRADTHPRQKRPPLHGRSEPNARVQKRRPLRSRW